MSLDIRSTYLNWVLTTSLGIALWYRNVGADRPLGGFLLSISLVFLFEYGIVGVMNPDTGGRLILSTLVFSLFILNALSSYTFGNNSMINILLLISVIILFWGLFTSVGSDVFDTELCSWKRNDSFILGSMSAIFFGFLFLTLFTLSFISQSVILGITTFLILLSSLFLLYTTAYDCFGYYFMLILLLGMFIYWIIPFFDDSFSRFLIRK